MGDNQNSALGDGFTGSTRTLEQVIPSPQPLLLATNSSVTNVLLTARALFGGTYQLLASTNPVTPPNQWVSLRTNIITIRSSTNFSATLTNELGTGAAQRFFRLMGQ